MNIKLNHITKSLDNHIILDDISLELFSNKIYGFVGRNGSGKSILFKTICGFIEPDEGSVVVNNENIYEKRTFPKRTLALIEKPEFIPELTGLENLRLLAEIQNKITDKEILESLELVNLLEEKDKKFKKYSLGMKQKLGIAQVIMENPDIMIFDEPFNGIDESSIKKIADFLKKKKMENKIVLIATHIKEDIDNLCDETYRMIDGKIKKEN